MLLLPDHPLYASADTLYDALSGRYRRHPTDDPECLNDPWPVVFKETGEAHLANGAILRHCLAAADVAAARQAVLDEIQALTGSTDGSCHGHEDDLEHLRRMMTRPIDELVDESQHMRCVRQSLLDALREVQRQEARWGPKHLPMTPEAGAVPASWPTADNARTDCDLAMAQGRVTIGHLLHEELAEALDPALLPRERLAELAQVSALAVNAAATLRRTAVPKAAPTVDPVRPVRNAP